MEELQNLVQETSIPESPSVSEETLQTETSAESAVHLDELQKEQIAKDLSAQTNENETESLINEIDEFIAQSTHLSNPEPIQEYLAYLFAIDPEYVKPLNLNNRKDVLTFILTMLEDAIYPNPEVKAFAQFARNGGTLKDFIEAIKPIDFKALSDEEVIYNYYHNRMDSAALNDYIETLKETGKLKHKADEIRKEVGVIELTPDEIVQKQKEILAQQEKIKQLLRNNVETTIQELGLKFKNAEEKREFIDSLVEIEHFYDANQQLVYTGTTFSYILNFDVAALVIAAYALFNYNTETEKRKSNAQIIENIKKNLIQSRNVGFAY